MAVQNLCRAPGDPRGPTACIGSLSFAGFVPWAQGALFVGVEPEAADDGDAVEFTTGVWSAVGCVERVGGEPGGIHRSPLSQE